MTIYKNKQYPIEQYGGRTFLMEVLYNIASQSNIPSAKFLGISYHEVSDMVQAAFGKPLQSIDYQNDFTERSIEQLHEQLLNKGASIINSFGFPALKTSYIANNNPNQLSFAGVGCTAIPRDIHLPLGKCMKKIIVDTQKEYSQYYRATHNGIGDLRIGCMLMENLPKQFAWGTVWSSKSGCIFEVFTSYDPIIVKHVLVKNTNELSLCIPESIGNKEQFFLELRKLFAWCQTIPFSDIEFCIGEQGLLATQYRPVPISLIPRLTLRAQKDSIDDCPPPYADEIVASGKIKIITKTSDIKQINNYTNEILLLTYHSQNEESTLKEFLFRNAEKQGRNRFKIISVVYSNEQWGHLHAIAAEDKSIDSLGYIRNVDFKNINALQNGDNVNVFTDYKGWTQIKKA